MSCAKRLSRVGDGLQIEPERPTDSEQANKASSKQSRAPTAFFPVVIQPRMTWRGCCPTLCGPIALFDLSPSPAGRQDSHHLCCGGGVEQRKWPCDRLYCALRDGSSDSLCARPSAGNTMLGSQPVGTRTGSHFTLCWSFPEEQGGRLWIKRCVSSPILSQNMGLSGHVS